MSRGSHGVILVTHDTGAGLNAGFVPEQRCHPPALPQVLPADNTGLEYVEQDGQSEGNLFCDFSIPSDAGIKQRVSEI